MRHFKLVLLAIVVSTGFARAEAHSEPVFSREYVIVSVIKIGDNPAKVRIESAGGKQSYTIIEGKATKPFKLLELNSGSKDTKAKIESSDGKVFLVGMKQSEAVDPVANQLEIARQAGLVDENGQLTEKGRARIVNNLRQIASAGQQYILENGTRNALPQSIEGTYYPTLKSVVGEDYKKLEVVETGGTIEVKTATNESVAYTY